jgi:FkbM family methyltransferase
MKKIIRGIRFRIKRMLFERFGIPKVQKMDISKAVLKCYLPKNPIIVDCGAHDGTDSVSLCKMLKGRVHSFEPVDEVYNRLKTNTANYKAISTYKLALSNENGLAEFYVSEGESDGSSSLLPPLQHLIDHPRTLFNRKIVVETKTLDTWAEEQKIENIDLLWLDMQGSEMNMLKASHKILRTVKMIHTEVSTKDTYKGVAQYAEYRAFLEHKGFKVLHEAIPEGWDMGNVLFIRKVYA